MDDTFDILNKYVDEHMDEIILDIIKKEYLSKFIKIEDVLVGKAVTYEFPMPICIDNDEHMWYNTFNKWSWNKFENGVIKIDENRI